MSVSHREANRGDRLLDILTDEDAGVRIVVSRLGAELVSLSRRDKRGEWIGFLVRDNDLTAPAKGWANHATVMGYYLHRLKDEQSIYRGRPIEGGSHGFLRHKIWRLSGSETQLSYRMAPPDFTELEYPLNVSLTLSYSIDGEGVRVTFSFRNHERELTAHVGFGLHPGFASTTFGSFAFEMPAGVYRRHLSPNNFLSGETEDVVHTGGDMPFAKEKLAGSYILELLDVPDRRFTYSDLPSGRSVVLDFAEVPYVTLWSDGGPFFCVEPCWGLTDHDTQRPFEDKEGIQMIPPGGELTRSFSMGARLKD